MPGAVPLHLLSMLSKACICHKSCCGHSAHITQADLYAQLLNAGSAVPSGKADWRSVRLGPLIGRGGFARVHWGRWQNDLVAIKAGNA